MNILIIQDDESIREKVVFSIESTYSALVQQAGNLVHASEILKKSFPPIELIICDLQRISAQELEIFFDEYKHILVIYCEDSNNKNQLKINWNIAGVIGRTSLIPSLMKTIDQLVVDNKITVDTSGTHKDFCKIRTKLLLSVCPLRGDIYIRLSDSKYIKLFHQGDSFELEDMEKYTAQKGVEYLYLKKNDCTEFIQKYSADLEQRVNSKKSIDIGEMAVMSDSIFDTIQELGLQLGFRKDIQVMTRTHMRMTVKSMGKSPTLASVLSKLDSFKGQYISSHSTLCGYIACAISSHLEWGSETTFHKLSLAAFLHDIVFENHQLAACESLDEVKDGTFTEEEKLLYKTHPIQVGEIAKKFQEIPPDVDIIILQHHELPDGSGFPRGIHNQHIAPLSCVFIVAHEISHFALRSGLGKDYKVTDCIDQLREKYTSSQFRKIIEAVEKL